MYDPRTNDIRYVGKSLYGIGRLSEHLKEIGSTRKCRWIAFLKRLKLTPVFKELERVSEDEWITRERHWITHFRNLGADLTNLTDGGEGLSGVQEETRQKMSINQKKKMSNPAHKAKIFTKERAAKISVAMKGVPKSEDHYIKIRNLPQNQTGRRMSVKAVEKTRLVNLGNKHRLGQPVSLETRLKLSDASRGNTNRRGLVTSHGDRMKKSKATRGIPKPDTYKLAISKGLKASWKKRRANGNITWSRSVLKWPPWNWIQKQLKIHSIRELAEIMGIKRGTLGSYILKQRRKEVVGG